MKKAKESVKKKKKTEARPNYASPQKDSALIEAAITALEAVESTSSKLKKKALLSEQVDNKTLQDLLRYAISKEKFGVKPKSLDDYLKASPSLRARYFYDAADAFNAFKDLLDHLIARKLTGRAADVAITDFFIGMSKLKGTDAAKWFHRILAKKLRGGIDHTVSEVWPGLVMRWGVPKGKSLVVQKTNKMDKKLQDAVIEALALGVDSQPKADGVHGVANCTTKQMHSSSGERYPAVDKYAAAVAEAVASLKLPAIFKGNVPLVSGECEARYDAKKDGEHWRSAWGKGGAIAKYGRKPTGFDPKEITPERQRLIDEDFKFVIYDIYPHTAQSEPIHINRRVKRTLLREIIDYIEKHHKRLGVRSKSITLIKQKRCHTWDELLDAHNKWIGMGYEGSILRLPGASTLADSKTRNISVNFLKWKEYAYIDCVILGVEAGKRNTKNENRGGAFVAYIPTTKAVTRVTLPTDAARDLGLKYASSFVGFNLEAVEQRDPGGSVAKSRFPVCSRFRDDLTPVSEKRLQEIAKSVKYDLGKITRTAKDSSHVDEMATACNASTKSSKRS